MKKLLGAVIIAALFAGFLGANDASAQAIEDFTFSPYYWRVLVGKNGWHGTGVQSAENIHSRDFDSDWWYNPFTGRPFCGVPEKLAPSDGSADDCDTKPATVDSLLFTYDPYTGTEYCPWVTNHSVTSTLVEIPSTCIDRPSSINYSEFETVWAYDPYDGQCYKSAENQSTSCKDKPSTLNWKGGGSSNGGGSVGDPGDGGGSADTGSENSTGSRYMYSPKTGQVWCTESITTNCDNWQNYSYDDWEYNPMTGKPFCDTHPGDGCEEKPEGSKATLKYDPVTGLLVPSAGESTIPPTEFWLYDIDKGMRVCSGLVTENENNCSDVNGVHGWSNSGSHNTGSDPKDVCEEMYANGKCNTMDCTILCGHGNEDEHRLIERVRSILNTVYLWAGIVAVVVIIISGVFFMISRGEADKVKTAKNALIYAVTGLVIVVSAAAITNFIISALGA